MGAADERLRRLLDRQTPSIKRTILTALRGLSQGSVEALTDALERADVQAAMAIAVGELDALTAPLAEQLRTALTAAARVTSAEYGLRFDMADPNAIRVAQSLAANTVVGVELETKQAIRDIIVAGIRDGIPPRESAREIMRLVGLTSRDATAVDNLWRRMLEDGVKQEQADARAARYADRLLRRRAENIARTETINASTQGRRLGWQQAADAGYLDPQTARIVWIVTQDDRLCFPAGTPVSTPQGDTSIETLVPGSTVTTPTGDALVAGTTVRTAEAWTAVHDSAGGVTVSTPDHAYWVNGCWVTAQNLRPGDPLGYEGAQVVGVVNFDVGDANDAPTLLRKLGVPTGILSRVVPVDPINFQGDATDSEVDVAAPLTVLCCVADAEAVERCGDGDLGACSAGVGEVTPSVTESAGTLRAYSKGFAAVGAFDVHGGPATDLGAEDADPRLGGHPFAAAGTVGVGAVGPTAGQGAYGVAVGDRLGNGEVAVTYRADLLNQAGSAESQVAVSAAESTVRRLVAGGRTEHLAAPLAELVSVFAAGRVVADGGAVGTGREDRLAAQSAAFLRLCGSIVRGDHSVYDITLVGQNSFFANGLLVHNCPQCAPLAGMTVGFYDSFTATERATGDLGDAKGGITPYTGGTEPLKAHITVNGPPLHPSCRCDLGLTFADS